MTWSVLCSWGGHLVFVVAGFILPRYIDGHLGQTALGVWDFGWSIVNYFGLAQVGIGSSVNRHVAKFRTEGDAAQLNRAVSSVMCIQIVAAIAILALTALATWSVPSLLSARLGAFVGDARWVMVFLGSSIAVHIGLDCFSGVLTGCHRWDLYNSINAGFHGAAVAAMLIALWMGGGLPALAVIYFCGAVVAGAVRAQVAHRTCPELRIRLRHAELAEARRMFNFGGKAFLTAMAGRLLYQTNKILVAGYYGPAALALYSRPMALVQHVVTFVAKFAYIFTPIASQMDAGGKREELRGLVLRVARYSASLALPPILLLAILGGPILRVWMGKAYEQSLLIGILAVGHLLTVAHRPLVDILMGMDAHGAPAVAYLVGATASVGLCFLILGPMQGGLLGAAICVVLPLTIVDGVFLPMYACRRLNLSVSRFVGYVWLRPILYAVPVAICFVTSRLLLEPVVALVLGGLSGALVLIPIYWKWVVPAWERDSSRGFIEDVAQSESSVLLERIG